MAYVFYFIEVNNSGRMNSDATAAERNDTTATNATTIMIIFNVRFASWNQGYIDRMICEVTSLGFQTYPPNDGTESDTVPQAPRFPALIGFD